MSPLPSLEILICTIDGRIRSAAQVPNAPNDGIHYLISWQRTTAASDIGLPESLQGRDDIRVATTEGVGLSANRNHALRHATGDILLLADDDEVFDADNLHQLRRLAAQHPAVDIFLLQNQRADGTPAKAYPELPFRYPHTPTGYYPSSCEIAIRRTALPRLPQFDWRFGLGSPRLSCGEEEVFLHESCGMGATIEYHPLMIAIIPTVTTGDLFPTSAAVRRSKGAVLCRLHGPVGAILRCAKFAIRNYARRPRICLRYLGDMWQGILYVRRTQNDKAI